VAILCIQMLIFSFSSSESLLHAFHWSMVLSPRLSSRSHRTLPLSVRLASGSSPAACAASIGTVLGESRAQGFCWETELSCQPIQTGCQGLSYGTECGWGLHSPHSGQGSKTQNPLCNCSIAFSAILPPTASLFICLCAVLEKKTSAETGT